MRDYARIRLYLLNYKQEFLSVDTYSEEKAQEVAAEIASKIDSSGVVVVEYVYPQDEITGKMGAS